MVDSHKRINVTTKIFILTELFWYRKFYNFIQVLKNLKINLQTNL